MRLIQRAHADLTIDPKEGMQWKRKEDSKTFSYVRNTSTKVQNLVDQTSRSTNDSHPTKSTLTFRLTSFPTAPSKQSYIYDSTHSNPINQKHPGWCPGKWTLIQLKIRFQTIRSRVVHLITSEMNQLQPDKRRDLSHIDSEFIGSSVKYIFYFFGCFFRTVTSSRRASTMWFSFSVLGSML